MTTLILIGLGLNLTPWGLTRFTWAAGWLVVSGAVLVWRRNLTTSMSVSHMRHSLRRHWIIGLYGVAALAIFVSAGILAMSGVRAWSEKPLLEFSLVSKNSSSVVVKIHAISTEGTYRIVASSTSRDASRYSSSLIMVNADDKGLALNESVPVNVAGRWTIYLNAVSGPGTSRELIVDVAAG
jgi:hypothetical protein